MDQVPGPSAQARFGIGAIVGHPHFGKGRVMGYDGEGYVIQFKDGQSRRVAFTFEGLTAEGATGDPALDRIKQAIREVLGEQGWLDADLELHKRWAGGTLKLIPGRTDTQTKEIPIEIFFSKIIGIRDKLRVLEQKINAHKTLTGEEKLDLEGYITRCYGSLTTFNLLFGSQEGQFSGTSSKEE